MPDRPRLRGERDGRVPVPVLHADGNFGPRTEAALKAVQRYIGTDPDGIYGPNTRDRMKFTTPDRVHCYRY